MSKIPARCNRRACQARRNIDASYLTATREQMPVCKVCGEGRLYVDRYRLNRLDNHQPTCTDPHCPAAERLALVNSGRSFPHAVSTYDCSGREDYVQESAIRDSKHRPFRDDSPTSDPF